MIIFVGLIEFLENVRILILVIEVDKFLRFDFWMFDKN